LVNPLKSRRAGGWDKNDRFWRISEVRCADKTAVRSGRAKLRFRHQ
jgi:hypothetical protein